MTTTDTKPNCPELLQPAGYRLLIKPIKPRETVGESGIILPDSVQDVEKHFRQVAEVVATGPDAYSDSRKFPNGAWCEAGDWIVYNSYAGVAVQGRESPDDTEWTQYKFINDDEVLAVTARPADIRVYA